MLGLSSALVELGHQVIVLCADEPRGGPTRLGDVQIRRLSYPLKVANTNITPSLPIRLAREPFDLVHTHLPTPWTADWSAIVGRARRKGVVLTVYNEIVGSGSAAALATLYSSLCLPVLLGLAHRIVINSKQIAEGLQSRLVGARQKLRLVPNGVDIRLLYPRTELRQARTLGFLAVLDQFHHYKGLDVLLMAVHQLVGRGHDVRLIVGGEGGLRNEYEQMARSLGLTDHVHFQGVVDQLRFFNSCEIFVLPATDPRREGFGLVVLEAMACGIPVVVSSAAGVAEVVEAQGGGLVVAPADAQSLAAAIETLLTHPEMTQRVGEAARAAVEKHFSWTAVARQYEAIYEEALRDAGRGTAAK